MCSTIQNYKYRCIIDSGQNADTHKGMSPSLSQSLYIVVWYAGTVYKHVNHVPDIQIVEVC